MKKKIKDIVAPIVKPLGYASLVGLVTFLSTIFCTNDSFSKWKEDHFYPVNSNQDKSIALMKGDLKFHRIILVRMEKRQEKMLDILINKRK